jgi:hypothetical protein
VEVRPWQTAEALAALVVTAEEAEYARDAERLADHEVDQAFAAALREATAQSHALTGAALTLSWKIKHFQQIVKEDQAAVQKLTQSPPPQTGRAAPAPARTTLLSLKPSLASIRMSWPMFSATWLAPLAMNGRRFSSSSPHMKPSCVSTMPRFLAQSRSPWLRPGKNERLLHA